MSESHATQQRLDIGLRLEVVRIDDGRVVGPTARQADLARALGVDQRRQDAAAATLGLVVDVVEGDLWRRRSEEVELQVRNLRFGRRTHEPAGLGASGAERAALGHEVATEPGDHVQWIDLAGDVPPNLVADRSEEVVLEIPAHARQIVTHLHADPIELVGGADARQQQ